jgi:hypothetical protein
MAVACSETVSVPAASFRADELAALVPAGAWQRLSCADGSEGPRLPDRPPAGIPRALVTLAHAEKSAG